MSQIEYKYEIEASDLYKNPEQVQIYNSNKSCVVLAGPGSGKTKVLTLKLARIMTEDIRGSRGIACITYSNECVQEIEKRLYALDIKKENNLFIGTVHSFCLQYIIKNFIHLTDIVFPAEFKIANKKEIDDAWEKSYEIIKKNGKEFKRFLVTKVQKYRRTYLPTTKLYDSKNPDFAKWIEKYKSILRENNKIDYDDIVLTSLEIIENYDWVKKILNAKFPHLIIDEYQDLGLALHKIVLNLCEDTDSRLIAFGDPDQSIYGFTGANPSLIKELSGVENVDTIQLKLNYRSSTDIVSVANKFLGIKRDYKAVKNIEGKINFYKILEGVENQAIKIFSEIIPDILKRNRDTDLKNIAILYQSKNEGDILEKVITEKKFNYEYFRIDSDTAYLRSKFNRWLEDCANLLTNWEDKSSILFNKVIIQWEGFIKSGELEFEEILELRKKLILFLLDNRNKNPLLKDWLNDFYKEILKLTIKNSMNLRDEIESFEKLKQESETGEMKDFELKSFSGRRESTEHLNLITLHSAKGLEFEHVILFCMEEGKIPYINANKDEVEESKRLFYVGITRAKKEIHITYSGWYENYKKEIIEEGPSRFVLDLKKELDIPLMKAQDFSMTSLKEYFEKNSDVSMNELNELIESKYVKKNAYYEFINPLLDYFSNHDHFKSYIKFLDKDLINFIKILEESFDICIRSVGWPFKENYRFGDFTLKLYKASDNVESRLETLKILWNLAWKSDVRPTKKIILNELSLLNPQDEILSDLLIFINENKSDLDRMSQFNSIDFQSQEIRAFFQ